MPRSILDGTDLTRDAFLGGRIHLWQPRKGFRSGIDAVLLAASVPARPGQSTLELGCGAGAASLCLAARVPGLTLHGVELQPNYADLARRNASENGADLTVTTADLTNLPADLRQQRFHHVLMNPPYFESRNGTGATDPGRALALAGETPLADWVDRAIRRLAPQGHLTLIQHITRLPEVLALVSPRLGSIRVRPIQPRQNRPANLFLLQARQEGRAPFEMLAPLGLHDGDSHDGDRESYTPQVQSILRNGAALNFGD